MLEVVSVNIGRRKSIRIGQKNIETGIFKEPTNEKVTIGKEGVDGDCIMNTKHHGGCDQAVYLYSLEDYSWWQKEHKLTTKPGIFGENLTLSSFGNEPLRIGDRFQINELILEVTSVRIPCSTFSAKMEDPQFIKKFFQAQRPGIYTRVISEGKIKAGDPVIVVPTTKKHPTITEFFQQFNVKVHDIALLRRALEAPVAERARAFIEDIIEKETKSSN